MTLKIHSIRRIDNHFEIIDQTQLPNVEKYIKIDNYQDMITAIKTLQIRGAPAIGIAAATACYLASLQYQNSPDFLTKLTRAITLIEQSRPTAVNLFYATLKVRKVLDGDVTENISKLLDDLMAYEYNACEKMAQNGFDIIPRHITRFLTHCNTGSLATYGSGTALGVIRRIAADRDIHVWVDETRPLLQGARLTMWELQKSGIPCTLITDNMAAKAIESHQIQAIITGADRIAKNGDTANKIGTFNLAILAKHFKIPFYIVAPVSTIDNSIDTGHDIVIEERNSDEINFIKNIRISPEKIQVYNPSFDVTPAELITEIITDCERNVAGSDPEKQLPLSLYENKK
jgi:methylthioribose-1-phosphate isomerase